MPLRFRVECLWNILFKKCGISNQPVTASAMIRVFPSLEHTPGESKRGRDTESDAVIRLEEIHTFFSNECFICSSTRNLHHALPVILLIKVKYGMLIAAVPFSI